MARSSKSTQKRKTDGAASKAAAKKAKTTTQCQLQVILPNASETDALQIIQALDDHLKSKLVKKTLESWTPKGLDEPTVPGIRVIQGNRYEVFCSAGDKKTDAFDLLVKDLLANNETLKTRHKTPQDVKHRLIQYATQQAERDDRIGKNQFEFGNFSLIINYTACEPQYPHIDLLYPNVQCGLVLTDKSPATIAYQPPSEIHTVQDLKQTLWKDMPQEVADAIADDVQCARVLNQFGTTLHPQNTLVEQKVAKLLPRGSLLTLPGSQLHGAPKCSKYRAILFFSGHRKGSGMAAYDPDTQYFGPLVLADFLMQLFHVLTVEGRKYLVYQICKVISTYKNLYRHLDDPAMRKFCNALGWAQYGKGGKEELIQMFCEGRGIVPKGGSIGPAEKDNSATEAQENGREREGKDDSEAQESTVAS